MSLAVIICIAISIGGVLFLFSYFVILRWAENKKWLLSPLWIGIISILALFICIGVTVALSLTTTLTIVVFGTAGSLGFGSGIPCGFTHYKLKHFTKKGW